MFLSIIYAFFKYLLRFSFPCKTFFLQLNSPIIPLLPSVHYLLTISIRYPPTLILTERGIHLLRKIYSLFFPCIVVHFAVSLYYLIMMACKLNQFLMAQLNSNLCFGALFNSFSCNVIAFLLLSYIMQCLFPESSGNRTTVILWDLLGILESYHHYNMISYFPTWSSLVWIYRNLVKLLG